MVLALMRMIALLAFTLGLSAAALLFFFLPQKFRLQAYGYTMQFWAKIMCLVFGIRIRLEGEAIPFRPGYLVVSNHVSYMDVIILGSLIPGVFAAKAQVRFWPVIGQAAWLGGTLFVERELKASRRSLRESAVSRLGEGVNVILFPEGTTSDGRSILDFRFGAFDIALSAKVSVLPVVIFYQDAESVKWVGTAGFVGHLFRLSRRVKIPVRVRVMPLVRPNVFDSAAEMAAAVRSSAAAVLGDMAARGGRGVEA